MLLGQKKAWPGSKVGRFESLQVPPLLLTPCRGDYNKSGGGAVLVAVESSRSTIPPRISLMRVCVKGFGPQNHGLAVPL